MEIISALGGITAWLGELELNGAEGSTQHGRAGKLACRAQHFQLDPSKQSVLKRAGSSSAPAWQPGQSTLSKGKRG